MSSSQRLIKVALFQNILPPYRCHLLNLLKDKDLKIALDVYANSEPETALRWSFQKIYSKKYFNRFYITSGLRQLANRYDVIVVMNDIHWISFMLLLFGPIKCKIVLWGQGITNSNNFISLIIRRILANRADSLLFYDNKRKLQFSFANAKLMKKSFVAINTLAFNNERSHSEVKRTYVLFVGRLNNQKRPLDLLKAYSDLPIKLKEKHKLVIIGEGELRDEIINYINKENLQNYVSLLGKITNESILANYFKEAICTVIPGSVGLGCVHSFAYGVPVVTARNRSHGPEYNYCNDSNTFFIDNSVEELKEALIFILQNGYEIALQKGHNAFNYYDENLNPDYWAQGFYNSCLYTLNNSQR